MAKPCRRREPVARFVAATVVIYTTTGIPRAIYKWRVPAVAPSTLWRDHEGERSATHLKSYDVNVLTRNVGGPSSGRMNYRIPVVKQQRFSSSNKFSNKEEF